jgi:hypothetical protein
MGSNFKVYTFKLFDILLTKRDSCGKTTIYSGSVLLIVVIENGVAFIGLLRILVSFLWG